MNKEAEFHSRSFLFFYFFIFLALFCQSVLSIKCVFPNQLSAKVWVQFTRLIAALGNK